MAFCKPPCFEKYYFIENRAKKSVVCYPPKAGGGNAESPMNLQDVVAQWRTTYPDMQFKPVVAKCLEPSLAKLDQPFEVF